ncbi:hypothetical protein [Bergeriella denitrificans]|nr:hypothetical protein [Bergeriella denitrificans]
MESAGAKFDFFNADGSIKDLREVTGILESEFGKIKAKYGDKAVMDISNAMFGSEGGRVADILIQGGLKAFDEMTAKMDAQASLSDRIKVKTGTLSPRWRHWAVRRKTPPPFSAAFSVRISRLLPKPCRGLWKTICSRFWRKIKTSSNGVSAWRQAFLRPSSAFWGWPMPAVWF